MSSVHGIDAIKECVLWRPPIVKLHNTAVAMSESRRTFVPIHDAQFDLAAQRNWHANALAPIK